MPRAHGSFFALASFLAAATSTRHQASSNVRMCTTYRNRGPHTWHDLHLSSMYWSWGELKFRQSPRPFGFDNSFLFISHGKCQAMRVLHAALQYFVKSNTKTLSKTHPFACWQKLLCPVAIMPLPLTHSSIPPEQEKKSEMDRRFNFMWRLRANWPARLLEQRDHLKTSMSTSRTHWDLRWTKHL